MELFLKLLVFLFPLFAVTVKSWSSTIHVFLFFTGIVWWVKNKNTNREALRLMEKIFIGLLITTFAWYLLSEYVNGWQGVKSHWPLIDFRFFMVVPVYLVLRNMDDIVPWLLKGSIIGCMTAVAYASYQAFYLHHNPPVGAYQHLYLGPVSAALALLLLFSQPHQWSSGKTWKILAYLGIVSGFLTLLLSTARSGMLATLVVFFLVPFLMGHIQIKKLVMSFLMILIFGLIFYSLFQPFQVEVNDTLNGIRNHLANSTLTKEEFYSQRLDNITSRFEMWRSALVISQDNLIFGTGRSGYAQQLDTLIEKGDGHPWMQGIDLPHNAYLYHLVMRGVPGLILYLALFLVPLIIFMQQIKKTNVYARLGVSWIVFFSVVSLTQSSVISRGHYLSMYLVVLVILVSGCYQLANRLK